MTWKSIVLGLTLLVNQNGLVLNMKEFFDERPRQEKSVDQCPDIKCKITADKVRWRVHDRPIVISVEIEVHGTISTSVMPAVHLTALPKKGGIYQDEYWAPFNVATGKSTSDWQKLGYAAEKKPLAVRLLPFELLWAPTKSSAWPSDAMTQIVPPREYSLQLQLEVNKGKTFMSNEVQITILK